MKNTQVTEYIYLNDNGQIMYTSRNNPLKYEDQTDCIKIEVDTNYDMDRVLDLMGLGQRNNGGFRIHSRIGDSI